MGMTGGINMKKKWTIISIIVGLLIMSIGIFVAVANNRTLDIDQKVNEPKLIVDPEVKQFIEGNHQFLRHTFYMHDKKLGIKLFHENDSDHYRNGMWSSIKDEISSDVDKTVLRVTSKVTDDRLKTDLTRAVELWYYAGQNKDEQALVYAYMIFVDLDAMINNYTSKIQGVPELYEVTELQGNKGQKYNEMINYYNKLKK